MSIGTDGQADRVVYGCMGLGGGWSLEPYTSADVDVAAAAIEAALDSGITLFDHADIYGYGRSEAVFGEVLARTPGLRDRMTLQTKCGIRIGDGIYDLRPETIVRRAEDSLARLRTDVIDILLLHRPDPLAEPAGIARAFTTLRERGLVRHLGVSNASAAQIALLQSHLDAPLVVNQLEMSLDKRAWLESEVLVNTPASATVGFPAGTIEHCRTHDVRLQAWGALAQGRFTGRAATPAEHAVTAKVAALADGKHTTAETIVLWWLQRHPARIAPVIGTANPDRIRACADAARREPDLTHEEWYDLWLTARGEPLP